VIISETLFGLSPLDVRRVTIASTLMFLMGIFQVTWEFCLALVSFTVIVKNANLVGLSGFPRSLEKHGKKFVIFQSGNVWKKFFLIC